MEQQRRAPAKQPGARFSRAFSHKVRTGCLTCKRRHKKCDEGKPFCRRCQDDSYKCDGYPHLAAQTPSPKTGSSSDGTSTPGSSTTGSSASGGTWTPPASPTADSDEAALSTALTLCLRYGNWDAPQFSTAREKLFFYHFHKATARYLAESPGPGDFWVDYVLPLAHQSEPVRLAVAAVGAAHQYFVHDFSDYAPVRPGRGSSSSSSSSNSSTLSIAHDATLLHRLRIDMMGLYNKSIRTLTRDQSRWVQGSRDLETLLVCCLLFVCFESLTGRYSESTRHLRAGIHMLTSGRLLFSRAPALEVEKQILDLFARVGVESSLFTNETVVPPPHVQEEVAAVKREDSLSISSPSSRGTTPAGSPDAAAGPEEPPAPFTDLREASFLLRKLDIESVYAWSRPDSDAVEEVAKGLQDAAEQFMRWNARFEETLKAAKSGAVGELDQSRLVRLDLGRHVWLVLLQSGGHSCCDGTAPSAEAEAELEEACKEYLIRARLMIQRIRDEGGGDGSSPTFSLDGDIVSGLAIVINLAPRHMAEEALALLKTINRREGIWDSRELAELYEAVLASLVDLRELDMYVDGGIPAMVQSLSLAPRLSPNSGIAKMVAELGLEEEKERGGRGLCGDFVERCGSN